MIVVTFLTTVALAQNASVVPDQTAEFLNVKLGATVENQVRKCKVLDEAPTNSDVKTITTNDPCLSSAWLFGGSLHVYQNDWVYTHHLSTTRVEIERDTNKVGKVKAEFDMSAFENISEAIRAKRGKPFCQSTVVQNLMGFRTRQVHCEWRQPWGTIAYTAPSSEDLTKFNVWAQTNHYTELERNEAREFHKEMQKTF